MTRWWRSGSPPTTWTSACSLFHTWAMRGAPFFFPTADLAVFTTGVLPSGEFARRRFIARSPGHDAGEVPYELGHATVSTWLNGGVAPLQVAKWAGHTVDVVLKVYTKCISGQEWAARSRIEEALG